MRVESLESRVESQKRAAALRAHSGSRLSTLDSRLFAGMTLVELLVVIVILTTIVGAAIPLMSPSNDDRRLREAARGLNTYITGAGEGDFAESALRHRAQAAVARHEACIRPI